MLPSSHWYDRAVLLNVAQLGSVLLAVAGFVGAYKSFRSISR